MSKRYLHNAKIQKKDFSTSLEMTKFCTFAKILIMDKRLEAFKRLLDIMDDLRKGCPWDKKQTIESLRHLTIEVPFKQLKLQNNCSVNFLCSEFVSGIK